MASAFNPFERRGNWPDALSAAQWIRTRTAAG